MAKTSHLSAIDALAKNPESQVDKDLVAKAINALLKYHKKHVSDHKKSQLFGENTLVQVHFNLEVAPVKQNPKPLRLVIPYEIYHVTDEGEGENLEEPEVCLIVKDDAKPWIQEMIAKFPEHMGHVKKVLTLDSLRNKHKEYKQRRELMQRYSMFMADDRIVPMLMKALGKKFWDANKHPIPIRITRMESLPHMIRTALRSTYMTLNSGTSLTVKAGYTGMATHKLVDNSLAIAGQAAEKIPRGWANIRSIGIRTVNSALLPVYRKTPEQLDEIARLGGLNEVYVDEAQETTNEEVEPATERKEVRSKSLLVKALKLQRKSETRSSKGDDNKDTRKSTKKDGDDAPGQLDISGTDKQEDGGIPSKPGEIKGSSKSKKKRKTTSTIDADGTKKSTKLTSNGETRDEDLDSGSRKSKMAKVTGENSDRNPRKELSVIEKKEKIVLSNDKKERKEYIASKSFSKSKEGYVYKLGDMGLGYYLDVKPMVDRAAIDAIVRAQPKGNGKRRSASNGKRRKRR